ncbi:MAG: flagellar export chaperone FliS [Candidatus Magnetomorum sp.]|nr:flagellar export chaperone FliS [Candidatus Magnetomorum sp.]
MKSMGYTAYKNSETQHTENKGKILSLLFEGAIRFTRFAIMGMEKEDPRIKGENISKVLAILTELDCALDRDQEKDLADNLNGLYQYMMRRLTHANFNNEKKALIEVDRLLSELKEAFDRAVDSLSA